MNKRIRIVVIFFSTFLSFNATQAQQLLGISNSNYSGTNGLYMNPSWVADSRAAFYLNLYTLDVHATNTYAKWVGDVSPLTKLIKGTPFLESDFKENLNGKPKYLTLGLDVRGPSAMFKLSPKSGLGITTRVRGSLQLNNVSDEVATLIKSGLKEDFQNLPQNNNTFNVNAHMFSEIGLSYGRVVLERDEQFLKVGITAKRVVGIYSAYMLNKQLDFSIKDQGGDTTLVVSNFDASYGYSNSDYNNLVSTDAFTNPFNSIGKIFGGGANTGTGWGVDVGFTYEYRPNYDKYKYTMDGKERLDESANKYKYRVAVSVMDIGAVTYKNTSAQAYDLQRTNLEIDENDQQNLEDNYVEGFNSILKPTATETKSTFKAGLPTLLNFNLDYKIFEKFYANVTWMQDLRKTNVIGMRQASMVALTPRIEMKFFELAFPISLINNYQTFSLGAGIKLGTLFIGSDNIAGLFNIGNPNGTNVYFGVGVPIYRSKKKDRDNDGVSDRKDNCKDTPGIWEFKGCPDTDRDGIEDKLDNCPTEAGLKEFNGCPDTDADGIMDKEDDCPTVAGLKEFKGCPDTDGDGIIDKDDKCPTVAGPKEFGGCPDKDGDGIMDSEDACPDVKGIAQFKGCPDTDGDGITDKLDECPEKAGPANFNGCPDRDFDNVPDHKDNCPDTYGTPENKGCPLVKVIDTFEPIPLSEEEILILKGAFDNLEFETGKAVIAKKSYENLSDLGGLLIKKTNYRLLVSGHTDNVGLDANNLKLSKSRANAVKTYLTKIGVAEDQVITEGFGSKRPIASNATAKGKQKNRRVELKIVK